MLTDTLQLLTDTLATVPFIADESLMDYVKKTAKSNEFFAGGAVLSALAGFALYGKSFLLMIWRRIDRLLRYQVAVNMSQSWLLNKSLQVYMQRHYPGKIRNALATAEQDGQAPDMKVDISLRQANDSVLIWHRRWFVVVIKIRERMDQTSSVEVQFDEEYRIWSFFGKKTVNSFLSTAMSEYVDICNEDPTPRLQVINATAGPYHMNPKELTTFKTLDTVFNRRVVSELREDLQNFLASAERYKSLGIKASRAYLFHGPPGCHAAGTGILMYDGSVKNVEDIVVGDQLMGPDSQPRQVLELKRGRERMVRITPNKGAPFVVNKSHKLSLYRYDLKRRVINTVEEYMAGSRTFKHVRKLEYNSATTFPCLQILPLDPYFLGAWLGDGTQGKGVSLDMHIDDTALHAAVRECGEAHGLVATPRYHSENGIKISLTKGRKGNKPNPILDKLRDLGVHTCRHIPAVYLRATVQQRLELLAGLLDTDGYLDKNNRTCFEITVKQEQFAKDIMFLCKSLGLQCTLAEKTGTIRSLDFSGQYWRCQIYGEVDQIPTKVPRKQTVPRKQIKNPLYTGFTTELLPEDNYYGFTLDKDHLYLTADFMIHHNSGKTSLAMAIAAYTRRALVTIAPADMNTSSFQQVIAKIGQDPVVLLFDDIHIYWESDKKASVSVSSILSALDGLDTPSEVIMVFTANRLEHMDPAFRRAGRIDREWLVGLSGPEDIRDFYTYLTGEPCGPGDFEEFKEVAMCDVQEAALRLKHPDIQSLTKELRCLTKPS